MAENGLIGARTLIIARDAGIAEPTLFQHFGTKNNLLRICFESVDREIAALFRGMSFTAEQIRSDPEGLVFLLWSKYFRWLITHRDETLFYFDYRTAPFFPEYDRTREAPWFDDFVSVFTALDREFRIYEKIPPQVLWAHTLSVTQLYAKLVLDGAIPSDDAAVQSIYRAQMGGLCAMLTGGAD